MPLGLSADLISFTWSTQERSHKRPAVVPVIQSLKGKGNPPPNLNCGFQPFFMLLLQIYHLAP